MAACCVCIFIELYNKKALEDIAETLTETTDERWLCTVAKHGAGEEDVVSSKNERYGVVWCQRISPNEGQVAFITIKSARDLQRTVRGDGTALDCWIENFERENVRPENGCCECKQRLPAVLSIAGMQFYVLHGHEKKSDDYVESEVALAMAAAVQSQGNLVVCGDFNSDANGSLDTWNGERQLRGSMGEVQSDFRQLYVPVVHGPTNAYGAIDKASYNDVVYASERVVRSKADSVYRRMYFVIRALKNIYEGADRGERPPPIYWAVRNRVSDHAPLSFVVSPPLTSHRSQIRDMAELDEKLKERANEEFFCDGMHDLWKYMPGESVERIFERFQKFSLSALSKLTNLATPQKEAI